jgi:hypothetical protein
MIMEERRSVRRDREPKVMLLCGPTRSREITDGGGVQGVALVAAGCGGCTVEVPRDAGVRMGSSFPACVTLFLEALQ